MTVHTICDRCGMEYDWAGVSIGDLVYCCQGCASGTGCTCPVAAKTPATVVTGGTVVADDDVVVVT